MPIDVEDQLAAYFKWIEQRSAVTLSRPPHSGAIEQTPAVTVHLVRPQRRRAALLVGVVTLVALIAVMVTYRSTGPPTRLHVTVPATTSPFVSESSVTTTLATPTSTAVEPSAVTTTPAVGPFGGPTATISWSTPADVSSIDRSEVDAVTAGPGGFVALGMGFDDNRNQGRLWFSPDGQHWTEPALATFDTMLFDMSSLTSTGDAFYVIAAPNNDRVPAGAPTIYQSPDGQHWTAVANAPVTGLTAVAGRFIGTLIHPDVANSPTAALGTLITSTDLTTWTPATFGGDGPLPKSSYGRIVQLDDRLYLPVHAPGATQLWTSTDGTTWELTGSAAAGQITATDNGLAVLSNSAGTVCPPKPDPSTTSGSVLEANVQQQWDCPGETTFTYVDAATGTTQTIEPTGLPTTPKWQPIVTLGHTAILPVLHHDGTLTLAASTDLEHWTAIPDVDINVAPDGTSRAGSPPVVQAYARHDNAVVIFVPIERVTTANQPTGELTTIVVGQAATP